MARWSFGPGSGNCCPDCIIWDGGIQDTYTGYTFDDDWHIYNDISQENMDLTALSGGAVILNKTGADYHAAQVSLFFTVATNDFTVGETFRIIIAATDNVGSAADYLYAEMSRATGEQLTYTLGYRKTGTDTVLQTFTDNRPETEFPSSLSGDYGCRWMLCYTGESKTADPYTLRLTKRMLDENELGPDRGLVSAEVPSTARTNLGKRWGITSSDWADSDVTPLPTTEPPEHYQTTNTWGTTGATYFRHLADVAGRDGNSGCRQCSQTTRPKLCPCGYAPGEPSDCSESVNPIQALVTCKVGTLVLPETTIYPEGVASCYLGECTYEQTFELSDLGIGECTVTNPWGTPRTATQVTLRVRTSWIPVFGWPPKPSIPHARLSVAFPPDVPEGFGSIDFTAYGDVEATVFGSFYFTETLTPCNSDYYLDGTVGMPPPTGCIGALFNNIPIDPGDPGFGSFTHCQVQIV